MKRAATTTAISLAVIGLLCVGFVVLRQQAQARIARDRAERVARYVEEIKYGKHLAGVSFSEMLPALAQDPDCVANLTDITFWCDVEPEDAPHVASLTNVKSMFFYCTDPSLVLPYAKDLPLEEIIFELVTLTPADIELLSQSPSLTRVKFHGQRISSEYLETLRQLPDRIELDLSDCEVEGPAEEPVDP